MRDTIDWAANTVLKSATYFDTVKIYVDRPIDPVEKIWLEERCGSIGETGPLRYQPNRWPDGIVLRQPTDTALAYFEDGFNNYVLSRVDVSLDLMTRSYGDAEDLHAFIERRLVQPWHRGIEPVVKYEGTVYYKRAGGRNNLVQYSDEPSKVTGQPCVHVEWRMELADAIRRSGLTGTSDLIQLDKKAFFAKRLKLLDLPTYDELRKIGRVLHGVGRSRPRLLMPLRRGVKIDRYPMSATVWLRASQQLGRVHGWAVQDVLDAYGPKWARYFRRLPTDWMFPE
jgi:hypothetical protein